MAKKPTKTDAAALALPNPLPLWLTRLELCAIARVAPATLDRLVNSGLVPMPRMAGPQRRIWNRDEVLAAMNALPAATGRRRTKASASAGAQA